MITLGGPQPPDLTEEERIAWESLRRQVDEIRSGGWIVDTPFD